MARRKRDNITASKLRKGDLFEPRGLGIKARVTRISKDSRIAEPHVVVHFAYPNDFSINQLHRGVSSSKIYRPDDEVTRWLEPSGK